MSEGPATGEMQADRAGARTTSAYPLSLRLDGRLAVVVGGGSVATRRVAGLRAAGVSVDWAALARGGTTLVLLMAVVHLAEIADARMAAGMPAGTPAACVAPAGPAASGWSLPRSGTSQER